MEGATIFARQTTTPIAANGCVLLANRRVTQPCRFTPARLSALITHNQTQRTIQINQGRTMIIERYFFWEKII